MTKHLPYKSDFLSTIAQVRHLLIIVAMKSEEEALLNKVEFKTTVLGRKLKIDLKEFSLAGHQVMVARSGIGLVNAAILLTQIAEQRPIDAVLLMGVGGALDPKLRAGDIVISNQIVQHDSTFSSDGRDLFIAPGELTLSAPPDQQVDPVMRCDSVLIDWAFETLKKENGGVFRGTILSGSEFVANVGRKQELHALLPDALLVDMEAAAVAQICRRLSLPFVAIKTVADRAVPDTSISQDYKRFLQAASEHGSAILHGLLKTFGGS